jgi:hypothetical protein
MFRKQCYLECDCGTEAVVLTAEEDLYISVFKQAFWGRRPLKYKLQAIWHIITTGEPYWDQIVISENKIKRLQKFLEEHYV